MLIALQLVATPQGPVAGEPLRAFQDEMVTIGRAPNCNVVLPDGLRIVSRQHARLTRQGGALLLTCLSASAPVHVNAVPVPHGGALPVRDGDAIHIGGFELRLSTPAQAASPVAVSAAASAPRAAVRVEPVDPAVGAAAGAEPAAQLSAAAPGSGLPRARARLDEWFDLQPLAPESADGDVPVAWATTDPVDLDLRSGAYGPSAAPASEPADSNSERQVFESLQGVLAARAEPPPAEEPPVVERPVAGQVTAAGDVTAEALAGPPGVARLAAARTPAAAPAATRTAVPAPAGSAALPANASVAARALEPASAAPAAPAAPAASLTPDASQALTDDSLRLLMQAFLDGAGIAARAGATSTQVLAPMVLTPAWMRHVGELLRASVDGALALLHSRSTVKREMRAEVTVIARRQNNPLKFAPDAAAALAHLVAAKRSPGFLEPVAALKDAHEDLLVHHLAVVAGMRAAMFELIARLGPEDVLREEGPAKGLAATLPSLQEAALWRRYRQKHAEMTARLDDDFETVFGREFTKAYEAQSRRVRDEAPPEDTTS